MPIDEHPVEPTGAVAQNTLAETTINPANGGVNVSTEDTPSTVGITFGGTATSTAAKMIAAWPQNTAVVAGQVVANGGNVYLCTTGGTTANAPGGPTGTGPNIADGTTVKWTGYAGTSWRGILIANADSTNLLYVGFQSTITAGGVTSGIPVATSAGALGLPSGIDVTTVQLITPAATTAAYSVGLTA